MTGRFATKLVTIWLPAIAFVFATSPVLSSSHMGEESAQEEEVVQEEKPDATLEIKKWKVGFILGGGGGKGKLIYDGEEHRLKISGLRIGAIVGIAHADLIGDVYNLTKPEDIEGTYTAVGAAIAIAGGGKVWKLKNSKGVVLKLEGKQLGIELALDVGGMSITLRDKDDEEGEEDDEDEEDA